MDRIFLRQWMLLLAYFIGLVIIAMHSGSIFRMLIFVLKQFLPLVYAGVLAMVLNRPYKYIKYFLEKKGKLPKKAARIAGAVIVYTGLAVLVFAIISFALPGLIVSVQQLIEHRISYMQMFENAISACAAKAGIHNLDLSPLIDSMSGYLGSLNQFFGDQLPQMAKLTTGIFKTLAKISIILVLSAYILYGQDLLKYQLKQVYDLYIPKKIYEPIKKFLLTAIRVFDCFIAGQIIESFILGGLCLAGMLILRLQYAGLVSIVVALTAFIPFFGAYIGCAMGVLLQLFESVNKAGVFLVFFVVLQQIENNLIYPRVVGKRTGLPPLWVLTAVTVGGGLFGIAGMVLSVPTFSLIYILLEENIQIRKEMGRQL